MATVATITAGGCSFITVKGAGVVDRRTPARLALKGTCNAVHDFNRQTLTTYQIHVLALCPKLEEGSVA